jgi:zinc metalloprotease ZmpB
VTSPCCPFGLRKRTLTPFLAVAAALAAVPASAHAAPSSSTAAAQVFFPNPVQSLANESLTDQKDADYFSADPSLRAAYKAVTLTDLDGSGTLTGTYAKVTSETGTPARVASNGFVYTRNDDRFEQVMAYYWVTQAQRYLQSLGLRGPVNARQQLLRINQFGGDNSFYREGTGKLTITLGKGGVDDAEDGEVIVHEYGHSVQDDQVPGFGSTLEAGSIGEAFGDYLAVTVSSAVTHDTSFQQPCVADWDSTSYTPGPFHCLRRVDGTKHYPEDVEGEVHADGELWSAALWRARGLIGDPTLTDKVIIAAQFGFKPDTTFRAAAQQTIATAQRYGVARQFRQAFTERGFLG